MLRGFSPLFRKHWGPAAISLKEAAGILEAVVGAAASLTLALQYGIDLANKARLFVFCISSGMSWQFCNNIEEWRFTTSPKHSHMVMKVLSRACTIFPSNPLNPPLRQAARQAFRDQKSCRF